MCSSYHQFVLVNEAVLVVVPELPELQPCAVPVGHVEAVSVAVHVLHELRQGQLPVPVLKDGHLTSSTDLAGLSTDRVEVRHSLVPVDAVHVVVVLGVYEPLELLLGQLQVLVPVGDCPPPPVPLLQLLELVESVGVHVLLQDPPPPLVRDVLVREEAVLDGAVLVPGQLRPPVWVRTQPEVLSPSGHSAVSERIVIEILPQDAPLLSFLDPNC